MKYKVLSEAEFQRQYKMAFDPVALPTDDEKAEFRDQVSSVQDEVLETLKRTWRETQDFEVGWDFNYCRHACGGIYSDRIFCAAYIDAVGQALKSVDPQGRWTYHTVAEIIVNPRGNANGDTTEDRGQFFIRDGTCYLPETMPKLYRRALGCSE